MESLNTCIGELQRQIYARRLELDDAHFGYAESRREEVRPQEELVMKEQALRDTQIKKDSRNGRIEESSGIAS